MVRQVSQKTSFQEITQLAVSAVITRETEGCGGIWEVDWVMRSSRGDQAGERESWMLCPATQTTERERERDETETMRNTRKEGGKKRPS